ncbi:hypothetical protein LINPERHAP1_LOCUS31554 [Linum perenne]
MGICLIPLPHLRHFLTVILLQFFFYTKSQRRGRKSVDMLRLSFRSLMCICFNKD